MTTGKVVLVIVLCVAIVVTLCIWVIINKVKKFSRDVFGTENLAE